MKVIMPKSKLSDFAIIEFDGHQDVLDYLATYPEEFESYSGSHCDLSPTNFHPWSWNETIQFMQTGWPEGVADVNILAESIRTRIDENVDQYNISFDVTGDFIDMGRFVDGTPECCGLITLEPMPQESINIVVNIGANAGVSAESMKTRGGALVALIDNLQKKYFVNLQLVNNTERDNQGHEYNTRLIFNVNMQNEYSRDLLAFYLSNICMLRRVCFAIREMFMNADEDHSHHIY